MFRSTKNTKHVRRDNIHCVIKGWASNNDGHNKAGFTAPSASSQATVMLDAVRRASIISSRSFFF